MAFFRSQRSNSFPSHSHPALNDVEDHLERLKGTSQEATSSSISSISANLASLRGLHDVINNMIQMPSIQQALSHQNEVNELLEGSLGLVDLCALSRDIVQLTKEYIQDLQSSVRRNKVETATAAADVNAYVASRKKINKMVHKCFKNLNNSLSTAHIDYDHDGKAIRTMLKEAESLDLSILKSVLILLSGQNKEKSNQRSTWSLLSKITQTRHVHEHQQESSRDHKDLCWLNNIIQKKSGIKSCSMDSKNMLKQLKASEMIIQEIEEGLESLFRSLLKTRVSLLKALSQY